VAHQDANIIFGAVIDDEMGDDVRVTVIAAGFDRWDDGGLRSAASASSAAVVAELDQVMGETRIADVFASDEEDVLDLGDDDFDVPSFLK